MRAARRTAWRSSPASSPSMWREAFGPDWPEDARMAGAFSAGPRSLPKPWAVLAGADDCVRLTLLQHV